MAAAGTALADMVELVERVITATAVMWAVGTTGVDLDSNVGMGVREGLGIRKIKLGWE